MKVYIAILATALTLGVCGTAVAQQDLRGPDQVSPARVVAQDLRGPDQVSPARVAVSTPEGGLSTLWIVLISLGGALTLAGIAYTGTHFVRQHGAAVP
ncbi:MAG TPA: hypothetical protein VFO31_19715 [Vicinamibacterales bacterium]|nr:hypothetical protein [Vicinamibacterales bacterium]